MQYKMKLCHDYVFMLYHVHYYVFILYRVKARVAEFAE